MTPDAMVRALLAEDRAAGLPFEVAYEDAVRVVCGKSQGWREVFEDTKVRAAWRAAYAGEDGPAKNLTERLLDSHDSGAR